MPIDEPSVIVNEIRSHVGSWRKLPRPAEWDVTPTMQLCGVAKLAAAQPQRTTALKGTYLLIIERALIIRDPWISLILSGQKTWEMRPSWTSVRGWIGLAAKGTNAVAGLARLRDCRPPLPARNYDQFFELHRIPADQTAWAIENNWVFPWVLSDVVRLPEPISFRSAPGAVQFVKLDADIGGTLGGLVEGPTLMVSPAQARVAPPAQARIASLVSATDVAPAARSKAVARPDTETPKSEPIFVFAPQGAKARAVFSGGKRLIVLKGSTAMRSGSPAVKRDEAFRDELVRQAVLVPSEDPELYVFARDFEFDSASRAAGIIKDGNASGLQLWRDPGTGLTLKEYLDRRGW